MKTETRYLVAFGCLAVLAAAGWNFLKATTGADMTQSAEKYLATLNAEQRAKSLMAYDTPQRVGWHFIPKEYRKGLQIREMSEPQRKAALALLRSALSQVGYDKATKIMALENLLKELEKTKKGAPLRDAERYYFTVFGEPKENGKWGLSVEGHHMSHNFVVENNRVVSSTPSMFGANPAVVQSVPAGVTGIEKGLRILAKEETLAFDLLASLSAEQRGVAVIEAKAPAEVRGASDPQPPQAAAVGLAAGKMNDAQRKLLRSLVEEYARNQPDDVADERLSKIEQAGFDKLHFAWAGADQPGIGHYYRVQGPSFLIEFVNTQPDAAGNPANHIHAVWRDMAGDFAIPVAKN